MGNRLFRYIILVVVLFLGSTQFANAAIDSITPNKTPINFKHADTLRGEIREGKKFNKLIGHVELEQGGTLLSCDSAYLFTDINQVEAFGNVHIISNNGSNLLSDYLKYNGNTRIADLKGNVSLQDGNNNLTTNALLYNTATKIGSYHSGGTLRNDSITLTSDEGVYNGFTKVAEFRKNVNVEGADYTIESTAMRFNTIKKVVTFLGTSSIATQEQTIYTDNGWYDTKNGIGQFNTRSTIVKGSQIIEANNTYYNKSTGQFKASGQVEIDDDAADGLELRADKVDQNEKTGQLHAEGNVYINNKKESTIIKAKKVSKNDKSGLSDAVGNVYVNNEKEGIIIYADKLKSNDKSGEAEATGNVYINDVAEGTYLTAAFVKRNSNTGYLKAKGKVYFYDSTNAKVLWCNEVTNIKEQGYSIATGEVELIDLAEARTLRCDSVERYDSTGFSLAVGKLVYISDSAQRSILTCTSFASNSKWNISLAKGNPIIRTLNDNDSLFIKADSFFNAPASYLDSAKAKIVPKYFDDTIVITDSSKVMLGLGHVKLFSDSLQAICDSLAYSSIDSSFKLFKNPIVWTGENQAIGDTIYVYTEQDRVKRLELHTAASLISFTKDADFYNQVIGDKIIGDVENNNIKTLNVFGNAESIYFNKDDKDAYLGVNKSKSEALRMDFANKQIKRITFISKPTGVFTPMDKITNAEKFLLNFIWKNDLRPKEKF